SQLPEAVGPRGETAPCSRKSSRRRPNAQAPQLFGSRPARSSKSPWNEEICATARRARKKQGASRRTPPPSGTRLRRTWPNRRKLLVLQQDKTIAITGPHVKDDAVLGDWPFSAALNSSTFLTGVRPTFMTNMSLRSPWSNAVEFSSTCEIST